MNAKINTNNNFTSRDVTKALMIYLSHCAFLFTHKPSLRTLTERCSDLSLGSSSDGRLGGGGEERIGAGEGKVSGGSFL